MHGDTGTTRRDFLKTASAATAALGTCAVIGRAQGADAAPLRAGLIGCGRRGIGAARNFLDADPAVKIVAMGDLFPEQIEAARKKMAEWGERVALTDDTCFSGFDAAEKVLKCDVDLVLLCAPPGFRPGHLRAAVEAGKHVFMEKPAATCPAGIRSVIESGEMAAAKNLSIVAGTQRRHQPAYLDIIPRIHDGAIGDIVAASCCWVGDYGYYPAVIREDGWTDVEAQIRNWNYFTWLSGDHIVEQHVHNIDIMNWALQGHPVSCFALGGRQQRTGSEFGHIYDHFAVEFEYPGGVRVQSLCRQNEDTFSRVGEHLVGTKGTSNPGKDIAGKELYRFKGEDADPYVKEHADLIASIRDGKPLNEARNVAESTMAAIMGRMSAYTGKQVTWKWAMEESKLDLMPKPDIAFGAMPVPDVAIPGVTKLV
jgi:predicted dehydrogenase